MFISGAEIIRYLGFYCGSVPTMAPTVQTVICRFIWIEALNSVLNQNSLEVFAANVCCSPTGDCRGGARTRVSQCLERALLCLRNDKGLKSRLHILRSYFP